MRSLQVPGVEPAPTRAVQEPSIKRSRSTKTYTPSEKADALAQTHVRPDSAMADNVSAAPSSQIPPMPTKRIDYDALAGDMVAASMQHGNVKSPIPPPTLIVRSEYPTITRSRGQQSLTCLVTVEVPEGKWKPDPEDFRGFAINSADLDEAIADPALSVDESAAMTDDIVEPYEDLEHTTNDLLSRVDNWHGLDFSRCLRPALSSQGLFADSFFQIWQAQAAWHFLRGKGQAIMAGVGVLSFRRDAHMREGEEECPADLGWGRVNQRSLQVHSEGLHHDQKTSEST